MLLYTSCIRYSRERIYNLTCVANNGINEMSHTSLLPILNQTCFVSLDIRPKTTKLSETSSWFRSEAVTLQAAFQREVCSVSIQSADTCRRT